MVYSNFHHLVFNTCGIYGNHLPHVSDHLACPAGRFRCDTGVCIPDFKKCDGVIQCPGDSTVFNDESDSLCSK